jgi:hypothetical protein
VLQFGPERKEVTLEWRKLPNEELDLYSSPSIFRVTKSRWRRRVGHIKHMRA